MSIDLLVAGLDLETGHEAHIDDQPIEHWRRKGHRGNKTLVCLFCYQGWDRPEPTHVPLVVKGRINGQRRAHFAHPPGQTPPSGHGPETRWHADAKQLVRSWAQTLPNVAKATVEHWIKGRHRRSDVQVWLKSGTQIAIEVQQQPLTDDGWRERHRDYAANGIVDIWLWHPHTGVPHVVYAEGQPGWILDLDAQSIGTLVGLSTRSPDHVHWPPSAGDETTVILQPLTAYELSAVGLELPDPVQAQLTAAYEENPSSQPDRPEGPRPNRPRATPHDSNGDGSTSTPIQRASAQSEPTSFTAPRTVPRGRVMLFPYGNRPAHHRRRLVSPPDQEHKIYRVEHLPPDNNPPESDRYICETCALITASLNDHF